MALHKFCIEPKGYKCSEFSAISMINAFKFFLVVFIDDLTFPKVQRYSILLSLYFKDYSNTWFSTVLR